MYMVEMGVKHFMHTMLCKNRQILTHPQPHSKPTGTISTVSTKVYPCICGGCSLKMSACIFELLKQSLRQTATETTKACVWRANRW